MLPKMAESASVSALWDGHRDTVCVSVVEATNIHISYSPAFLNCHEKKLPHLSRLWRCNVLALEGGFAV